MGCCASTGRVGDEAGPLDPKHVDLRHFVVQRTLGEGGFGKVNAVIKKSAPEAGTWYAMKMLGKRVILEKRMLEEILRELTLLKEIRGSRFVCAAYYAFQDEAHLYLVLDLYLGGDLRFHLSKAPQGRMAPAQVAFYGASLVLALDFLHARGVLHRDIKPENVLMDSAGHVALTDLGISAKVEARPPTCTQTSGTLGYMAPEIFWEGHLHGIPSEAYSLGVLLHELSTGARPYPAPIWERLHHRGDPEAYHRSCEAAAGAAGPLFKGRDGAHVPGEMQTLVRQLLQPRPERRGVGAEVGGLAALKAHAAFAGVDWEALASKTADPPFVPPADANVQASAEELFGGGGGDDFGGGGGGKAAGGGGGGGGAIPPSDQALFESYSYDYRDPPPSPSPSPSPHSPGISLRRSFVRLSLSGSAKGKGSGRFSFIASGSVNTRRSSSTASTGGCLSPATPGSQPPPPLTASSSSRRLRVAPEEQEQREEHQGVEALPSLTIPMPEALTLLPAPEESEQEGQEPQQPPQPLQPQSLAGEEVTAGAAVVGAAEGRVDEPLALPVGEGVEVDGGKGAEAVVELTAAPEGAGVLPVVEE